jgi:arylsulfatase A-like enzyme
MEAEMARTEPARRGPFLRSLAPGFLLLAAWVGLFISLAIALREILANRFPKLGMVHLPLELVARELDRGVLTAFVAGALVLALAGSLHVVLSRWNRTSSLASRATWWIVLSLCGVPSVLILVYRLNRLPSFLTALSPPGLAANFAAVLGMLGLLAWLSAILYKRSQAVAAGVARLGRPRAVAAFGCLLLVLNALWLADRARHEPSGMNVVLITVDTLRPDHLGCYGYARNTSPEIDALARESTLFRAAMAQWPKTGPSFASMLSSTYGHTNGLIRVGAQPIGLRFTMLAESFREAGYRTAAIVTNPNVAAAFHFDQGFEVFQEVWRRQPEQDAGQVSDRALAYLRKASPGAPFLLWLHYVDPHARYEPPESYRDMFVGDPFYEDSVRVPLGEARGDDIGSIPGRAQLGTNQEVGFYIARYDAEIRYMDAQVGRVLDEFRARNLAGNTVVVLTSDHGESLGEHNYYFEHGRLPYDSCARVPLLIRWPGRTEGGHEYEGVVELVDIVPTLLEAVGLPPNPDAEGKSLVALLEGRPPDLPEYALTESGYALNYQRAIRNDVWKLIYVPSKTDRTIMQGTLFELYQIREDPGEKVNLIDAEPELVLGLLKQLSLRMGTSEGTVPLQPGDQLDIDTQSLEALRALGYVN